MKFIEEELMSFGTPYGVPKQKNNKSSVARIIIGAACALVAVLLIALLILS